MTTFIAPAAITDRQHADHFTGGPSGNGVRADRTVNADFLEVESAINLAGRWGVAIGQDHRRTSKAVNIQQGGS